MSETTRNFYSENRYPREAIRDFTRSQKNLSQSQRVPDYSIPNDPFFSGRVTGSIDLLYRFTDSYSDQHQQYPPALGFQYTSDNEEEEYELIYIDPAIEPAWKNAMDRVVEDW